MPTQDTLTDQSASLGLALAMSAKPSAVVTGALKEADLPAALSRYVSSAIYSQNTQVVGKTAIGNNLGAIATSGYYGNIAASTYKGNIISLFISVETAQTVTFVVGLIDQWNKFIAGYSFDLVCAAGSNTFQIEKPIKAGEICMIKTPINGLRYATDATSNYYKNAALGDALTTQTGSLAFQYVINETIDRAVASVADLAKSNDSIAKLQADLLKPRRLVAPNGTIWQEKMEISNSGVASITWVPAVPSRMLFIGNSITKHPINSIWWGLYGMAASSRDKDYVHRLATMLTAINPAFAFDYIYPQTWETTHSGFDYSQWDAKIASFNPDYILVRLGENISDFGTTNVQADFSAMFAYLKSKAPGATIGCGGVYWRNDAMDAAMQNAGNAYGVRFTTTWELNTPENCSYMNAPVMGDDNQTHYVNSSGVAAHPGDAGMLAIAQKFMNTII